MGIYRRSLNVVIRVIPDITIGRQGQYIGRTYRPYVAHIWPYMAHIWPYMAHIWPYMVHVWPYIAHIWPYMDPTWPYMAHIWQYMFPDKHPRTARMARNVR